MNNWTQEGYNKRRHSSRGDTPDKGDGPVSCQYMEDQFGNVLPLSKRSAVGKEAKGWWQDQVDSDKTLRTLRVTGTGLRDQFRTHMENKFPWLRLCEDHWKADRVWSDYFSKWKPAQATGEGSHTGSQQGIIKRERSAEEDEGEDQAEPSLKRTKIAAGKQPASRAKPKLKVGTLPHDICTIIECV